MGGPAPVDSSFEILGAGKLFNDGTPSHHIKSRVESVYSRSIGTSSTDQCRFGPLDCTSAGFSVLNPLSRRAPGYDSVGVRRRTWVSARSGVPVGRAASPIKQLECSAPSSHQDQQHACPCQWRVRIDRRFRCVRPQPGAEALVHCPTDVNGALALDRIGRHASREEPVQSVGSHREPDCRVCTTVQGSPLVYRYVPLISQPPRRFPFNPCWPL